MFRTLSLILVAVLPLVGDLSFIAAQENSATAVAETTAEQQTEAATEEKEENEEAKSEEAKSEKAKEEKAAEAQESKPEEQKAQEKSVEKEEKKEEAKKDEAKKEEAKKEEAKKVEVRHIALSGNYVDMIQPASLDVTSLLMGGVAQQKSFYRLCDYIDELVAEEELKYIVFDLSNPEIGMNSAQLDELARRMKKLQGADKKTIAWLEDAGNVQLAIAACCDQVLMADFGGVDMPSAAMESMFYRDAMDLVGVKASVVRAGDFKGAVEPYMNSVMSTHLREHYLKMLQSINDASVARLAEGRGLKVDDLRKLQSQRILLPAEALAQGLVDKLAPYGSMKESIDQIVGEETNWTTPKAKAKKEMSFFEVMGMMMAGPSSSSSRLREDSIAVLHLSGAIVDGKTPSGGQIVAGPTVKEIEELAKEPKIKGVVVRINSPGGSATASEAIRQALLKLAKEKPTVVSMGEMAASGGYWISCLDVPVYAERGTITGSIGVFAMKLSFGSLMKRVGVHVEAITLDDSAAFFAMDRAWTDDDVAKLQTSIDQVYTRFLKLVSESRGKSVEEIEKLAGGRVWSGAQARDLGLVDVIGGLDDCLAAVAKKTGLEKYKVLHRPKVSAGLNLGELLGGGDEDNIFASGISTQAVRLLQQRGLQIHTTQTLLRDAATRVNQRPTLWLLNPAEMSIRQ
jgi:protease-4